MNSTGFVSLDACKLHSSLGCFSYGPHPQPTPHRRPNKWKREDTDAGTRKVHAARQRRGGGGDPRTAAASSTRRLGSRSAPHAPEEDPRSLGWWVLWDVLPRYIMQKPCWEKLWSLRCTDIYDCDNTTIVGYLSWFDWVLYCPATNLNDEYIIAAPQSTSLMECFGWQI